MPKKTNTIHCMPSCNWSLLACGTLACEASRRLLGEGWRLNLRDAGCSVVVFTSNGSQAMQAVLYMKAWHTSTGNVEHFHCSLHILQSCHHGKIHLLQKTSRDQSFLAIQPVKNNLPVVSLQLSVYSCQLSVYIYSLPASEPTCGYQRWLPTLKSVDIIWHQRWFGSLPTQINWHHVTSISAKNQLSIIWHQHLTKINCPSSSQNQLTSSCSWRISCDLAWPPRRQFEVL